MADNTKPPFDVPPGAVAKVSIIDSTLRLSGVRASQAARPPVEGLDVFPTMPLWSFLVESPDGSKALYDLGAHKELGRYVPSLEEGVREAVEKGGWKLEVKEHVADILRGHGVSPDEIGSVIWSHSHFDHIGDMTTFPGSTELVVGPGFAEKFLPGYPTNAEAPVREEDMAGRAVRGVNFDGELKVGPFPAHDFFGDGSFYLLDTPGHCLGHIAGLARTSTNPDTFIMMGGDLAHHTGELRPSPYTPIPDPLPKDVSTRSTAWFQEMNGRRGRKADEAFMEPEPSTSCDGHLALQTVRRAQVADAQDNVWLVCAHDTGLFGAVDLFPQSANAWREKGWKERVEWKFLGDLDG